MATEKERFDEGLKLMGSASSLEAGLDIILGLADDGYYKAQAVTGQMLEDTGKYEEAAEWYRKAAAQGHQGAKESLEKLIREGKVKGSAPSSSGSSFQPSGGSSPGARLAGGFTAPSQSGGNSAAELFEKAYAADKAGNQQGAFDYFMKAAASIGANPTDMPSLTGAFYSKALALQQAGNRAEAIVFYKAAAFFGHEKAATQLAVWGVR